MRNDNIATVAATIADVRDVEVASTVFGIADINWDEKRVSGGKEIEAVTRFGKYTLFAASYGQFGVYTYDGDMKDDVYHDLVPVTGFRANKRLETVKRALIATFVQFLQDGITSDAARTSMLVRMGVVK